MPRIIFRCPYLKGGTAEAAAHLENYVSYVATRQGVDWIDPGRARLPVTRKQRDMVEKLLKEFPLSRGLFEYEDYRTAPTRGSASEFITRAIEDNLDSLAKRENYLDYIAKRPRAQRMGPHGLFTSAEDALVLSQVAKEVAEHRGNVWLPIISLRREDAARLGYDSAESWRALLSSYAPEMAKAMKIPWDQFRWYASYHDEGYHPHVHMVCYSADPAKGYLTRDGLAKIKSDLAGQIFRQELTELYARQTQWRDGLAAEAQAALERLIRQMQSGTLENGRIERLTAYLAQRLKFTTGKKQYGYLKAPLKSVVDEIVDELAKDPRVAEAYRLWYELRDEVLRTYREDLPGHLPLSQQKEFKKIKNLVIQEALRLEAMAPAPEEAMQGETPALFPEEDDFPGVERPLPDGPPPTELPPDEAEPDGPEGAKPRVAWSDRYKLARQFLYGAAGQPPDFESAYALFLEEAHEGNALAMHDLGRMWMDGLDREIDVTQAQVWYAKALAVFLAVEDEKPGRYTEYRIGKLYAAGLGTDQDYGAAADWFAMAAEQGHKYAGYSLAGLYSRGQGVEQNHQEAHRLYTSSAEQGFPYAAFELGKQLRDGVGCAADMDAAARWFATAYDGFLALEMQSHDDKLQYRIGWMRLHGVGAGQDKAAARTWFEKAARLGNPHAQYQLARLILADSAADADQVAEALSWLTKAAEAGQDCAQYALGKLHLEGKALSKDVEAAVRWLTASAEQGNQFAQYALGKLYLLGRDVPKDKEAAVRWFILAAEQGNEYAGYFLEHMDDPYGPTLLQAATRLLRHLGNIFRDQAPPPSGSGGMRVAVDKKLLRKIREKKMAQGHKADDHEPTMTL